MEAWLDKVMSKKRRYKRYKKDCEVMVYPDIGDAPLTTLTRSRVREWLTKFTETCSEWRSRAAFTLLRSACNWAISQELYPDFTQSPCDKISVSDIGEFPSRQILMTPQQLGAYWLACGELDDTWCTYWRTLLLSAQRRSDIGNARYRELDFERRTLTIPSIRYKTGVLHVLPLTPTMEKIFSSRPRGNGDADHLWSFTDGETGIKSFSDNWKLLKEATADRLDVDPKTLLFTAHDMRRTARSFWASIGARMEIAELILGHQVGSAVLWTYAVYYFEKERRELLHKWEAHIINQTKKLQR